MYEPEKILVQNAGGFPKPPMPPMPNVPAPMK